MDNSRKDFYGDNGNTSLSYLEFGSIDLKGRKKSIWGYWHDQEAYDLYMFSRYAKDMFAFRKFVEDGD